MAVVPWSRRICPLKRRRVDNPPNPYLSEHREWLEPPPEATIEVHEETAGSILSRNDSPDLPFVWSVNPYRGCQHACSYCYARTYHEYLGYGAGTDFDTKLVVKVNAPQLLRKALQKPSWRRERINFSGVTDCYQPIEAVYGLTRQCLSVCLECDTPVAIVTKGVLIERDIDVLTRLHKCAGAKVLMSVPFADVATSKLIEPQAPAPARRFEAMRRLNEAGVPVGVFIAPVIPGLTDKDIPSILEQAAAAGARTACFVPLRLPSSVESVFVSRLQEAMPRRVNKILNRLSDVRGGDIGDNRCGHRMRGTGAYWESVKSLFEITRDRLGLGDGKAPDPPPAPRAAKPTNPQLTLDFQ